jgi:hypothetical protein
MNTTAPPREAVLAALAVVADQALEVPTIEQARALRMECERIERELMKQEGACERRRW